MKIEILKQLSRSSEKVSLARNEAGALFVLKKYQDFATLRIETKILNQLSVSGYAPKVLEKGDNYIIYEYIEGELLSDKFTRYTMSDDHHGLVRLANELSIFLQIFYSLADGYIIKDISFTNFIIKDGRCYGIDYDSVGEGLHYTDIAGVVAYAATHSVGNIYSCFPFIRQILKNFKYKMIDIINDVREELCKSKQIINVDGILSSLMWIDEKKFDKFI